MTRMTFSPCRLFSHASDALPFHCWLAVLVLLLNFCAGTVSKHRKKHPSEILPPYR